MLAFAVVAVFIAGLMVGRTPEYLGKKIEAYEMKMASLVVLIPCALVVIGTAIAVLAPAGVAGIANPGIHGFSEILYALSSASNNNGSAFGGLSANTPFWNTLLGICMFLARFPLAIGMLAIAGSLAAKKHVPPSAGTLPTHTPLFIVLLASTVIVIGALTFLPALALGPIAEHLSALRTLIHDFIHIHRIGFDCADSSVIALEQRADRSGDRVPRSANCRRASSSATR